MKKIKLLLIFIFVSILGFSQHTISDFNPKVAGKNELITITGNNFGTSISGVSVKFGGVTAAQIMSCTNTQIVAKVGTGVSGNISVTKSGVTITHTTNSFIFRESITEFYGDFGGYWKTTTTSVSSTPNNPNNTNNMLAFKYGSTIYSTGVNDDTLTSRGITFTSGNFKGLPVTLLGSTCTETTTPYVYACNRNPGVTSGTGNPIFISTGSNLDGTTSSASYTHVNIKDLTIRSVLTDGTNGLDISTGYTNLVIGSVSTYDIKFIDSLGVVDNIPDIIVTQTADPTGTTIDSYEFLDASGTRIGRAMNTLDLNTVELIGNYVCDLYIVPANTTFSSAKPSGVNTSNGNRPIRLVGFRLSDFGITSSNYNNVEKLKITASGKSDVSFIAYNANTIHSLPLVDVNSTTDSVFCAGETNLNLKMDVTLPGEAMTYQWELKVGGVWVDVSGATSTTYTETSPILGNMYRLKVTVVSNGYFVYSPIITLSGCLPVELISFNANCEEFGINLEWKTASEFNSDYFQIWKSENVNDWRMIEQQKAAGYSTELLSYNFTDKEISNSYYLLHQVDFDGVSKTYDPIYVNCDVNNILLTKPNPSNDNFSIVISSNKKEITNLIIFDTFGNKILEKEIELTNGLNTILINDNLKNGIYFIKINTKIIKHITNK